MGHCHDCGLEPLLGPELRNLQEALATIASGAAWTLLTSSNAPDLTPGVAVRPLRELHAHADITLAWRATGASELAHAFVQLAVHARDEGELDPTRTQPDASVDTDA